MRYPTEIRGSNPFTRAVDMGCKIGNSVFGQNCFLIRKETNILEFHENFNFFCFQSSLKLLGTEFGSKERLY